MRETDKQILNWKWWCLQEASSGGGPTDDNVFHETLLTEPAPLVTRSSIRKVIAWHVESHIETEFENSQKGKRPHRTGHSSIKAESLYHTWMTVISTSTNASKTRNSFKSTNMVIQEFPYSNRNQRQLSYRYKNRESILHMKPTFAM